MLGGLDARLAKLAVRGVSLKNNSFRPHGRGLVELQVNFLRSCVDVAVISR